MAEAIWHYMKIAQVGGMEVMEAGMKT